MAADGRSPDLHDPAPGRAPTEVHWRSSGRMNHLMGSFAHAWDGLLHVARTQRNWRIHVAAAALVALAGLVLQVGPVEFAALALAVGLVLGLEVVNTAIEAAVDTEGGPYSIRAKHAKDAGAAAVLIAAATAVVVALLVFGPRVLGLLP